MDFLHLFLMSVAAYKYHIDETELRRSKYGDGMDFQEKSSSSSLSHIYIFCHFWRKRQREFMICPRIRIKFPRRFVMLSVRWCTLCRREMWNLWERSWRDVQIFSPSARLIQKPWLTMFYCFPRQRSHFYIFTLSWLRLGAHEMLSAADILFCSMSVSQPASALNKIFAKGQINSPTWRII